VDLESSIYQWRQGERSLRGAPHDRIVTHERVVDAIVAELRRRLGGRFTAAELSELYRQGTSWCLQKAVDIAPKDPWAWEVSISADAAFARYLREAADYAGGRQVEESEDG
jgi:hypothetical protein